jgi:endonuclease YncB( thermonuclease family)
MAKPRAFLIGTVVKVVDGDTVHVRVGDRIEKVRYIGMNAPELHHPTLGEQPGGREAAEANRKLVDGQTVRLELDVHERDRYGRLLAYVYVGDTMVNAESRRAGLRAGHDDPAQRQAPGRVLEAPAAGSCAPAWAVEGRRPTTASIGTLTDSTTHNRYAPGTAPGAGPTAFLIC